MIRNSLKQLETELNDPAILRCYPSFMVNFDRVKLARKEKDGLVLELDVEENLLIPISKTYVDQVMQIFSRDLQN